MMPRPAPGSPARPSRPASLGSSLLRSATASKSPITKATPKAVSKARSVSPLDRELQALRDQEAKLRAKEAQIQQDIDDIPRIRAEQERRIKDERAADIRVLYGQSKLTDKHASTRMNVNVIGRELTHRGPTLRKDRRDVKVIFLSLCLVFFAVMIWVAKLWWLHFLNS